LVDKCDDVNAYVECVGELLSNRALAKEKATIALERLQEQHSEEAFAARLADILKK
jgi:glycosyltransferase involved in cell wall biosynthesis